MNKLSIFRGLTLIACCLAVAGAALAQEVTGQWAFDGTLTATIGQDVEYFDPSSTLGSESKTTLGTCDGFGIPTIDGSNERVLKYSSYEVNEGLAVYSSASPNAGGTKVNQYTIIWDILFATSPTDWWALYQADPDNQPFSNDADFYYTKGGGRLTPDNGLGILGDYQDAEPPIDLNTWYRIACAVDLTAQTMDKYVDGTQVGTTALDEGIDARWAIESASSELPFLLFTVTLIRSRGQASSIFVHSKPHLVSSTVISLMSWGKLSLSTTGTTCSPLILVVKAPKGQMASQMPQ